MFDTYEANKFEKMKQVRADIVKNFVELDSFLTEEALDKDEWFKAYQLLNELGRFVNNLEKVVLVIRCRRMDESEFRKHAKTGK